MAMMGPSGQGKPPDWDEDRRANLYGAAIFFLVLTTITVFVRLGCQFSAHRKLFLDDLFIVLAMIFDNTLISVDIFGMTKGLGLHIDRVMESDPHPPGTFITLWKVGWINSICIYLCLFCVKMSLLWLYRRLFWIARWFRIGWYINLGFAVAFVLAAFFTAIFQCTPVSYAWNRMYLLSDHPPPFEVRGSCINLYYATYEAALSLASDLGIWILPVVAVWKLQMTVKRKIELFTVLSLGLAACACGFVKTVMSHSALSAKDVSWANAPLAIWASAEQSIGILCACIPVIAGAIKSMRNKKNATSHAYKIGTGTSHGTPGAANCPAFDTQKAHTFGKCLGRDSIDDLSTTDISPAHRIGPKRNFTDDLEMQPPRKQREWK